jgi:hypothetical protein
VIERARRYVVDERLTHLAQVVDPAAGDGSAEKILQQHADHHTGELLRERVAVGLTNDGRLQCFSVCGQIRCERLTTLPATVSSSSTRPPGENPCRRPNSYSCAIQGPRSSPLRSAYRRRSQTHSNRSDGPLDHLPPQRVWMLGQSFDKMLADDADLWIKQPAFEKPYQRTGAIEIAPPRRRFIQRQISFQKVHMRVLPLAPVDHGSTGCGLPAVLHCRRSTKPILNSKRGVDFSN